MKDISPYILGFMVGAIGFISYSAYAEEAEIPIETVPIEIPIEVSVKDSKVEAYMASTSLTIVEATKAIQSQSDLKEITSRLDQTNRLLRILINKQ